MKGDDTNFTFPSARLSEVISMTKKLLLIPLIVAAALVVVVVVSLPYVIRSSFAKNLVLTTVRDRLGEGGPCTLDFERMGGNGISQLEIHRLSLSVSEGPLITIPKVRVTYALFPLLWNRIVVTGVKVDQPEVFVERRDDGSWNLDQCLRVFEQGGNGEDQGSTLDLAVKSVKIRGGMGHIDFDGTGNSRPRELRFEVDGAYRAGRIELSHYRIDSDDGEVSGSGSVTMEPALKYWFRADAAISRLDAWSDLIPDAPALSGIDGRVELWGGGASCDLRFEVSCEPDQHLNGRANVSLGGEGVAVRASCRFRGLGPVILPPDAHGIFNGNLEIEGSGKSEDTLVLNGALELQESRLMDRAVEHARVSWRLREARLEWLGGEITSDFGDLKVRVTGDVRGLPDGKGPVELLYQGSVSDADPRVWFGADAPKELLNFEFEGRSVKPAGVGYAKATTRGRVRLPAMRFQDVYPTAGEVTIRGGLADGWTLDGEMRFDKGRADGFFRIDSQGEYAYRLNLKLPDVSAAARLFTDDECRGGLEGTIQGSQTKTGHFVSASLTGENIGFRDFQSSKLVLDLEGNPSESAGRLRFEVVEAEAGDYRLRDLKGDARGDASELSLSLSGRTESDVEGDLKGTLFNLRASSSRAVLEKLALHIEGRTWTNREPVECVWDDRELRLVSLVMGSDVGSGRLSGRFGFSGDVDAKYQLQQVEIGGFLKEVGMPVAVSGFLTSSGSITFSEEKQALSAEASVETLRVADKELPPVNVTVESAEDRLRLLMNAGGEKTGFLRLEGSLPVDGLWPWDPQRIGKEGLEARLEVKGLDISLLQGLVPTVEEIGGRADLSGGFSGTLREPSSHGVVNVGDGRLRLAGMDRTLTEILVEGRWDDREVVLTRGEFHTGAQGTGKISGRMTHKGFRPENFSAEVMLDGVAVAASDQYRALVDGDLRLSGTPMRPVLEGKVEIGEGELNMDRFLAERKREVVVLEDEEDNTARSGLFDRWRMDAGVRIRGPFFVRGEDFQVELGGELDLHKKAGAEDPEIRGRLDVVRGYYAFYGKTFLLSRGYMRFLGVSPPDPNLDVTGTYRISGTDITLHLGGKVSKTTLDLSSDPSLSRSDIISLLLFGRKASDLNRSQSVELANTVYGYLGAEALRTLKERFGRDIPLDLLTIEQGGDTNGSALILGKYLTPRLFVVYRRGWSGSAQNEVRIEYELLPGISVESDISEGRTGADVFWSMDY